MQAMLFDPGRLLITPGALAALGGCWESVLSLVRRHLAGDWSGMDAEDRTANAAAVRHGARVFSAYALGGCRFWVITEADRSATTILLPEEY